MSEENEANEAMMQENQADASDPAMVMKDQLESDVNEQMDENGQQQNGNDHSGSHGGLLPSPNSRQPRPSMGFFNSTPSPTLGPSRGSMGMMRGPPPMMHGPPGMMRPPGGMRMPPQMSQEDRLKQVLNVPPDQEIWVETQSPDGKSYFYNAISRKTVWERPENAKIMTQAEIEEAVKKAQQPAPRAQSGTPARFPPQGFGMPPPGMMPPYGMPYGMYGTADPTSVWQEFTAPDGRKYFFNTQTQETTWDKPQALKDNENKQASAQPGAGESADASKADNGRPISSNPVAGTPWCVVWTGDQKVFFFNPSSRTSVWERPPELYGRPDVDLLVSKPPKEKPVVPMIPTMSMLMGGRMDVDGINNVGENDEDEPPIKKKKEKKKEKAPPPKAKEKEKPPPPEPKPMDPAIEAEMKAAKERAQIPVEVRMQKFKEMLVERSVSAFSTWEKELSKIVFDQRYLLLSSKERKEVFENYVKERAEIERTERKKKAKEAKEGFKLLLQECKLHGKSSFSDFASKSGKDPRFKAIEKMHDRENLFNEFVTELRKIEKEERRLQKEKHKQEFVALLKEKGTLTRKTKWSELKKKIDSDSRYKQVDSSSMREEWFREFVKALPEEPNSDDEEEKARRERLEQKGLSAAEKAIRDRQKEVEAELGEQLKERNKEQERHKYQEADDHFRALLADQVKSADASWKETRKQLRKDQRWEMADLLDKEQKERLFDEHLRNLERKRREAFYQLLNDTDGLSLSSNWKETRKLIKDDPRYSKLCSSERRAEREFREYMTERVQTAKSQFRDLLRETKIITYKSKQTIVENEQHLKDILTVLENDKRYLVLDKSPEEREKLLETYLDELDRRGPPPPPTQQEPSRRGPK